MSDNFSLALNTAGLTRIILVNSYINTIGSKLFEFDFQKHTQINGANGSGKTSLLKLIPFFYGLEPGRITSSSNVKKSFSGYYLPSADSNIIFEYISNEGKKVHVVVSNAGNGINNKVISYRFIPCEFNTTDFIIYDELLGKYRAKTWIEYKDTLRSLGVKTEAQVLSVDQYRSIIQNIPSGDNHRLRKQYSLSSGRKELRYIDSITHSLITGHVNFDNIKLLLSEIIKRDHQNMNLELKANDISRWCNDVNAFNAVNALSDRFSKATYLDDSIKETLRILKGLYRDLGYYQEFFDNENSDLKTQKESKEIEEENYKLEISTKHNELNDIVHNSETDCNNLQEKIDSIEQEQANFEEKNAPLWTDKYNHRKLTETALAKDEEVLNSVNAKYDNINQEFESKKNKLFATYSEEVGKLKDQKSEHKFEKQNRLNELENIYHQNLENNKQSYINQTHEYNIKITELKGKQDSVNQALKNISIPEDYQKQLQENATKLNQIQDEARQNQKELIEANNRKQNLEKKRDKYLNEFNSSNNEFIRVKERLKSIDNLLSPDTGMLSGFLNEHIPDWKDNIGKVINENLLERNDLLPQIEENAINCDDICRVTIANLSIKTDKLPTTMKDNSALLQEQAELTNKFQNLAHKIEELKENLEVLESDLYKEESHIAVLSAHASWDDRINELKNIRDSIQHKINTYREEQRLLLTSQSNDLTTEIKNLNNSISQIEKQRDELKQHITESYLASKSDIETKYDELISNIDENINKLEEQYKLNIKQYEEIRKTKLKEGQIDDKLIDNLEKSIRTHKQNLEEIDQHEDLVRKYQKWQADRGNSLQNLREKLTATKSLYNTAVTNFNNFKKEVEKRTKLFRQEIKQFGDAISENKDRLADISGLLNRMQDLFITNDTPPIKAELSYDNVSSDAKSYIKTYINNFEELNRILKDINACMNNHRNTSLFSHWEQSKSEDKTSYVFTNESYDQKNAILEANAARMMIEHIMKEQKTNLLAQGQNISHMISEYYYHLKDFDNRIKGFSNRISNIVKDNLQFEAFDSFNVHLETKIKDLSCWSYIEKIAQYYSSWEEKNKVVGTLPETYFINDMLKFTTMFEDGTLRNDINDLFNIVFEVMENGKFKKAKTARELEDLSSNGLTFLLICALYISLIHESRNEQNIRINWPVDEMSKLSNKNIHLLLKVMDRNLITMVSAAPDLSTAVALQFNNIYRIAKDGVYVNSEAINPIKAEITKKQAKLEGQV